MIPASHPWAGVLLAAGSAVLYNTGFVLEKQALTLVRTIRAGRPWELVRGLVGSSRWLAGFTALLGGLALQIAALTMAPISLVQPIFATGLLLLLVLSHLTLGERHSRADVTAVMIVIAAVVCLGASLGRGGDTAGWHQNNAGLALVALPTLLVAAWCFRLAVRTPQPGGGPDRGTGRAPTALYGLAAGAAYGVASVATKAVAVLVQRDGLRHMLPAILGSPALYLLGVTSAAGLIAFQVGLQRPASILVPVSNVTSSAYAVIVGSALFGERLPASGWQAALRVIGLLGVLAGVVVLAARQPDVGLEPRIRPAVRPDAEPAA